MVNNKVARLDLAFGALLLVAGASAGCEAAATRASAPSVQTKASQDAMTPAAALQRLADGNKRFRDGRPLRHDLKSEVRSTSEAQYPFAAVLGCIDSRVSPEIVFDQGIGDIFSVRVAGNIVDEDVLGSLEYATEEAGAHLVVILGHTHCGAIKGACQGLRLEHLSGLLDKIRPAIAAASAGAARDPKDQGFLDAVAEQNVRLSVSRVLEGSAVIRELTRSGRVAVRGAVYDVETGSVRFLK